MSRKKKKSKKLSLPFSALGCIILLRKHRVSAWPEHISHRLYIKHYYLGTPILHTWLMSLFTIYSQRQKIRPSSQSLFDLASRSGKCGVRSAKKNENAK